MPRLTIFAKGNADLRGSLHALIEDGAARWNGINELLRARHPGWTARLIHETMGRSDALLQDRPMPVELAGRDLPLGAYPAPGQFATRLFDGGHDVVVLSIQPDVMDRLARHRGDGHLLYPHDLEHWPTADREWLAARYDPAPPIEPEQSMANLAAIVARLRQAGDPRILIFNMSPIVPWEQVHCYQGIGETLACRIRRFNIALTELSRATGISIVDVDAVVARAGAERLKIDAVSLTAEGCRLVAAEVVRILDDLGCFAEAEAAA